MVRIVYDMNGKRSTKFFTGTLSEDQIREIQDTLQEYPGKVGGFFVPAAHIGLPPVDGPSPVAQLLHVCSSSDFIPVGDKSYIDVSRVLDWFQSNAGYWFTTLNGRDYSYQELDQVYRFVQARYTKHDVIGLIQNRISGLENMGEQEVVLDPDDSSFEFLEEKFQSTYHCSLRELLDSADEIVERFWDKHDWSQADMDQLEYWINEKIQSLGGAV